MTVSPLAARALATLEDAELIAAAAEGDDRAFSILYRRHVRYIAGIVHRLIGDDAEVDDVIQQTFIEASNGLASLREPAAFRGWLAAVAVRRVQRRLLRRYRLQRLRRSLAAVVVPFYIFPPARAREDVSALFQILETIEPQSRIPWFLHHVEGEQLAAVARMCEVSLATVKRRIAGADAIVRRGLRE
jgi:RNA polymerase sigma-70 factor (ECF subfamily)